MSEIAGSTEVRRTVLRRIIARTEIRSQADLVRHLADAGFAVTQATVSRDLAAIGAHKQPRSGGSVYVVPGGAGAAPKQAAPPDADSATARLQRLGRSLVVKAARVQHFLVLHCPTGAAGYLAGEIDHVGVPEILGSIAGDDTVLVIVASPDAAERIERLLTSARGDRAADGRR